MGAALRSGLLAILLCASCPQAREAVAINRALPGEGFLDRQHIPVARVFERKESAANSGNHFGFAPNHPARRPRRREIANGQRATVGPDDVLEPPLVVLGHVVLRAAKIKDTELIYSRYMCL
jgi:hypothetical protein